MKLKTSKGIKKRFRILPSGKIIHARSGKRHLLGHKPRSRKRLLRVKGVISEGKIIQHIKRLMPFAKSG